MLTTLAQGFLLGPGASTFVDRYAWLWDFIWIITGIFVVLNAGLMVLFVIFYRQKNKADRDKKPHGSHHSNTLEIAWSLPPLVVVIAVFGWGFRGYMDMVTLPQHGDEIVVTAWKWGWQFTYPNGVQSGDLYLKAGEDVTFILEAQDVIHSFYIPQARIKKDCVPGRYNKTWMHPVWNEDPRLIVEEHPIKINADTGAVEETVRAMELDVYCTEYCGTGHSVMRVKCYILQPDEYDRWMEVAQNWKEGLTPFQIGERLYTVKACNTCHSLDGSAGNGPTWLNLYGNPHPLPGVDVVDEDYLREAILYPGRQIVPGWGNVMPVIAFQEGEVSALIEFIKRQSDAYQPADDAVPADAEADVTNGEAPTPSGDDPAQAPDTQTPETAGNPV
ncbi:MAG: cytochrome c oxidase subunit II transmembrane domain-containing protein [Planctomycetota bacterium]